MSAVPTSGLRVRTSTGTPSTPPPLEEGHMNRCAACGLWFPLLVDDGDLCLRCDAFFYPGPLVVRRVA